MKNTTLILSLILSLILISCTPEDKNLNRPQSFGQQGDNVKNLKVGTYGQVIWAVQNIEHVGNIMNFCLGSDSFDVETSGTKTTKNCKIIYKGSSDPSSLRVAKAVEIWKVSLNLKHETDGYSILSAQGELTKGSATVLYKTINAFIQYSDKSFTYRKVGNQRFKIDVLSGGEIGSNIDSIKFNHQATAEGELLDHAWKISSFEHELELLNKGQIFKITSDSMTLNWVSPSCADAVGTAVAVEAGKSQAIIKVVENKATGPKWSQDIKSCGTTKDNRKTTALNFEYLFF